MTHTCDPGFMLDGADVRECVLSDDPLIGVWSEPLPICNRKSLSFLYRKCIMNLYIQPSTVEILACLKMEPQQELILLLTQW